MCKRWIIVTLMLGLWVVGTVRAETSLQSFVAAIPNIAASHTDSYGTARWEVINLLRQEFELRYGDSASWDELLTVYNALAAYGFRAPFGVFDSYLQQRPWNLSVVERWLEDHPVDFATSISITFQPYTLTLDPYDFDGDGSEEWLVYVTANDFSDIWVAWRDDTQSSGYRLYTLPIPHREVGQSWTLYEGHGSTLEYLGDANGDGTLEMVFSAWAMAPASWSHATNKRLYVVGWTGEDFEELVDVEIDTYAQSYDWEFSNIDDDEMDELVAHYFYDDNWLCNHTETHLYDWDGHYYVQIEQNTDFEPTLYCDLRRGEELVNRGNYNEAVPFYEQALARFETLTGDEREMALPFAAFAQERLVIAYAFADRMDDALLLLDEMRISTPPNETIAAALVALPVDGLTAERLCHAAYDAMEAIGNPNDREEEYYRGAVIPGVDDTWYGDNSQIAYWSGRAGCDYDQVVWQHVQSATYPVHQPPADVLETMDITTTQTITLDLNGDDTNDWVVASSLGYTLLFLSQGENYAPPERNYVGADQIDEGYAVTLPNGAEAWYVALPSYESGCDTFQGMLYPVNIYPFILWQYDGDYLSGLNDVAWCGEQAPEWTPTETISLWEVPPQDIALSQTTLIWNNRRGVYELQINITVEYTEAGHELYGLLYEEPQFTEALELADTLLAETDSVVVNYYRAVALEMLGRTDEAQEAYHHVIELDANAVYADLATLWLEE